jgi:hypothetical protein
VNRSVGSLHGLVLALGVESEDSQKGMILSQMRRGLTPLLARS